jgi:hypothetical protein
MEMKKTEGYVTDDGTFFENHLEAALHEAESKLRGQLATAFPQVDIEKFLAIVLEVMPQLWSYIHAHNTASAAKSNQQAEEQDRAEAGDGREAKADGGIGHVSSTEEDLASLLKLPPRGPSHVSNVGSSPRTKKIPERRAKHGA